jgi:cardiolipin synthase A/B
MFRLDQLVVALARRRVWLTDVYFAGTTTYAQGLIAAAQDGVDVRLLLPNATDIPVMKPLSRFGYRTLLEASVRVFEWNGARVTTPRHHVQYVVTEYGSIDLSVLSDSERPAALIELAHPDFRDSLRASLG